MSVNPSRAPEFIQVYSGVQSCSIYSFLYCGSLFVFLCLFLVIVCLSDYPLVFSKFSYSFINCIYWEKTKNNLLVNEYLNLPQDYIMSWPSGFLVQKATGKSYTYIVNLTVGTRRTSLTLKKIVSLSKMWKQNKLI